MQKMFEKLTDSKFELPEDIRIVSLDDIDRTMSAILNILINEREKTSNNISFNNGEPSVMSAATEFKGQAYVIYAWNGAPTNNFKEFAENFHHSGRGSRNDAISCRNRGAGNAAVNMMFVDGGVAHPSKRLIETSERGLESKTIRYSIKEEIDMKQSNRGFLSHADSDPLVQHVMDVMHNAFYKAADGYQSIAERGRNNPKLFQPDKVNFIDVIPVNSKCLTKNVMNENFFATMMTLNQTCDETKHTICTQILGPKTESGMIPVQCITKTLPELRENYLLTFPEGNQKITSIECEDVVIEHENEEITLTVKTDFYWAADKQDSKKKDFVHWYEDVVEEETAEKIGKLRCAKNSPGKYGGIVAPCLTQTRLRNSSR
jgi:hypothetical protein